MVRPARTPARLRPHPPPVRARHPGRPVRRTAGFDVLHTAAYWLMPTVRDAIPRPQPLATAEFTTLRLRPLKRAARVAETAPRVRIAFAAACPEAELSRGVARSLQLAGP